jgi:superfamily I DNA/RNA helicase
VAVLARHNVTTRDLRGYLCSKGLFPRQLGSTDDFEEAHGDLEQLPLLRDAESVGRWAIDRVKKLVPTLEDSVVETVKRRLLASRVDRAGRIGTEARSMLEILSRIYDHGAVEYFRTVVALLDACVVAGHHLPRMEAVRALRATAHGMSERSGGLDDELRRYSGHVTIAAQAAPRFGKGVYLMTAHQSKGKEFDMIILAGASARDFPDDEESRRLFYVAVTRATKRWVVLAPERHPSPLLDGLRG